MGKQGKIYNTKIIESGERLEIYKYQGYITTGEKSNNSEGRRGKAELTKEQKEENTARRRKETLVTARNNIIRLISCNSNDLRLFITLTYKDNFQDLKKSKEHLKKFFKKLSQDYKNLKYVYVLEYQERGAIHYHILTNIEIDIKTSRSNELKTQEQKDLENYFRVHYWSSRGWVDIRALDTEGIKVISKYVSSYLVEDLFKLDLKGNRAYGYSKNLNKPIISTIESKLTIEDLIDLENYSLQYTSSYKRIYTDKTGMERESNVNYFDYLKE